MYVSLLKTKSIICFGTKLWCFSLRSPVTSKPSMPFIRARTSWAFVISASWWKGFGWVFAHNRLTFMFKSLHPQINTTLDEKDRSNPFRFANIGVEKFLELNSEQNHDDYCLAYVFTDRDFDDGVLGLAWVGAPSGISAKNKSFS